MSNFPSGSEKHRRNPCGCVECGGSRLEGKRVEAVRARQSDDESGWRNAEHHQGCPAARQNLTTANDFKQIVLEEKAGLESGLVPGGAGFVNTRLRAQFGEAGWANDEMKGIGYLFTLRELANDIDKKWKSVLKKLETIRELLINRRALICNVTLDAENWKTFQPQFDSFLAALPAKNQTFQLRHPAFSKKRKD